MSHGLAYAEDRHATVLALLHVLRWLWVEGLCEHVAWAENTALWQTIAKYEYGYPILRRGTVLRIR